MSVKKALSFKSSKGEAAVKKGHAISSSGSSKRQRFDSCFSFKEISLEPAAGSSLKEMDSNELKLKIMRWAKAVVAYARQVSGRFGSSRTGSSRS